MRTQQFRSFLYKGWKFTTLVAVCASLILVTSCATDDNLGEQPAALQRSNLCEPACVGERMGCFVQVDCQDPSCAQCLPMTCPPDNPVQACAEGAICDDGQCQYSFTCDPTCGVGTHCAAGHCIPNYSPQNVCSPLESCRSQCVGSQIAGCLNACEQDRSGTCAACQEDMKACENQHSCTASATGCCRDLYCQCFPNSAECSDMPCKACLDACQNAENVTTCFNQCAGNSASCSSCIQPFVNNPDCTTNTPTETCKSLWYDCTGQEL